MADSRSLLERQQLLALVAELRRQEGGAEPVDPERRPLEIVDAAEAYEREHSSPSVLGG